MLHFKTADQFEKGFAVTDAIYIDFLKIASEKGIKRNGKDLTKSDRYVKTMIKAYIGRNLLDNDGFFPVMNTIDPAFIKAMEILEKKK